MPASKQKRMVAEQRRAKVAELYLKGIPQHEIVRQLGFVNGAGDKLISIDLRKIREDWKNSAVRDVDDLKHEQYAKLVNVEKELWEAYNRSQKVGKSVTVQQRAGGDSKSVTSDKRDGDPRWTKQIMECINQQSELLGIIAKPGEDTRTPAIISFKLHQPEPDKLTEENKVEVVEPDQQQTA